MEEVLHFAAKKTCHARLSLSKIPQGLNCSLKQDSFFDSYDFALLGESEIMLDKATETVCQAQIALDGVSCYTFTSSDEDGGQ